MIYYFPVGVSASSYPCSPGHMGSTSHLANELGNEDRDNSTIDGRIQYCRTPYARMLDVDRGSNEVGGHLYIYNLERVKRHDVWTF